MRKLVALFLAAGAALLAYRWYVDRAAYDAYERFADTWARENRLEAAKYGDAETVRHAFDARALRGTRGGAAMEAFRGTRYAVESRRRSPGGDLELVVVQSIFFDPPGVTTGIGGAMVAHFRHAATVRRAADGWRVVAFEPTFLDMAETRRRRP